MTKKQKIKELEKEIEEKNAIISQLQSRYDYAKNFVPRYYPKRNEENEIIGKKCVVELIVKKRQMFKMTNKGLTPKYLFISPDMLNVVAGDEILIMGGMYFNKLYGMEIICCNGYKGVIEVGGYND